MTGDRFYPNVTTRMWLRYVRVFAVAISSVCRPSVTFVHPTQPVDISGKCFYAILYPSHPLTTVQNFTEIDRGESLRRGLNVKGVAKYSDVGHVENYIIYLGNGARYSLGYNYWLIGNHTRRTNGTTLEPLGWPLIRVLGPNLGKVFISLKLI